MFLKVTFPLSTLTNMMFLNYNWLYVRQYFKASLLLPIVLHPHSKEEGREDDMQVISTQQVKIQRVNWLWLFLCATSCLTTFLIALVWGEK